MFTLHPQLAADTLVVGDLPICRVLLNKLYSQYPWVILVPKRTGCRDWTDLPEADYLPAMEEIRHVHDTLRALVKPDKMNVAALGNMVPQLHIHIIARTKADPAWPAPTFGTPQRPYGAEEAEEFLKILQKSLDVTPVAA